MSNLSYRVIALAAVSLIVWDQRPDVLMAQQRRGQPQPPPVAPPCVVTSDPLPLELVLQLLIDAGENGTTYDCVTERVVKQKVTFRRIPDIEKALRAFKADERLIQGIPPPDPSPAVARPSAGPLTVTCEAECTLIVNGAVRTTERGTARIMNLPAGKQTLVVHKEGYRLYSTDVELREGVPQTAAVQLQRNPPDPALRQIRLQAQLWKLHSETGDIESMQPSGGLYWTGSPKDARWGISLILKAGGDTAVTITNVAGAKCEFSVTAKGAKPPSCEKKLKDDPATDVVTAVKLFLTYQPNELVPRVTKRNLIDFTVDPKQMETVDPPDKFHLVVDDGGLLAEVEHTVQNVVWKVRYSEYKDLGAGRYPTRMEIAQVGGKGKWEYQWTSVKTP